MVLDTTTLSKKEVSEKLYKHEKEELEAYCDTKGIKGKDRELFIENSLKSVYATGFEE